MSSVIAKVASSRAVTSASKKVDPQRPSTWKKYKKGMCNGCSAGCCTLPLEVSAYDLIRLGLSDESELGASMKKTAKRLIKAKIVRSFNASSGIFILEQHTHPDGVMICIYNAPNKQCTVYEKRPEVCRQYPKIGPRPGWCPSDSPEPGHQKKTK